MGHIRIGRLPKRRGWKQVIALLDTSDSSLSQIAEATARAAKTFFTQRKTDAGLVFSYWFLTQITYRARIEDFTNELKKIGFDISNTKSSLDFLNRISEFTRNQMKSRGETFPLSEIAQLSFQEVLTETIGQESQTLFGTTLEDIRLACRRYSTPIQFAKLARIYFSKILNRILQFFISKESPNKIGTQKKFEDIADLSNFNDALEAYCYQSAKIVEDFAKGWYSKKNWQGEISEQDAKGFVAVAMQKLRDEMAHEESPLEEEG